ncbi:MAG: bifunctional hydroxymethylpyrimidine kinase/phosphomethylpyrimidine kinase [Pseudanabaenaceae cyanobacterium SKYGB_i_bin29]|nr:bifunctional hydroxymethylpyrimidine kinase/phosphomethylpyrimidine kinase [Pseudanabaenaceae cyanobacterium SKYG29]MDW8421546.1 bifunctional hydroxymethylpyrimidine kinase/phosphomethylpyrimidine kinase [Pseudanabaenaceae cyanobacterium SKYGB_i_bin29]
MERPPVVMTIAGSDSGGGAGIQADLKTFAFHCVHGTSAITCVTAQNTQGVTAVEAMPLSLITAQIDAVAADMQVAALKTGMLLKSEIVQLVAKKIVGQGWRQVVVDPVMVSRTGAKLLDEEAIDSITHRLLPLALLITPNRYEAQLLTGRDINGIDDMQFVAEEIHKKTKTAVLVKGGGMTVPIKGTDVYFDGEKMELFPQEAIPTPHTHGTGCTLSAAIVANLALGFSLLEAVKKGKAYVTKAIEHSLTIGRGQGPVGHFFPLLAD